MTKGERERWKREEEMCVVREKGRSRVSETGEDVRRVREGKRRSRYVG